MNLDDIKEILNLVRENELSEFEYERDGLKLRVKKAGNEVVYAPAPPMTQMVAAPPPAPAPAAVPAGPSAAPAAATAGGAAPADTVGTDLAVIKAPLVGTFYSAPEPGAKPFAAVGDTVKKDQVLCIIEAMKLMNEIKSDCDGEVVSVYVQNGQAVQFGERLFAVKVK
jgi:acetyl-CoA carboxylase biotin carboxyl carrier protein